MNVTLDYLKSNRKWLVRNFRVWGDDGAIEADVLMTEMDSSYARVVYLREYSGGTEQVVRFADLIDHRGNRLPTTIIGAAVILVPKGSVAAFTMGIVGPESFRIAKSGREPSSATVDLMVMEMN